MGFFDWLKRLFGKRRRDVSMLGGEGVPLDLIDEKVELEGGPLKPKRLRRIRRDPRLVPKRPVAWPMKRPRIYEAKDAARMFSASMRTKDRQIRDLASDVVQLERYGLPVWRTEADIAEALSLSTGQLRWLANHRRDDRVCHYVSFAVPKRRGGERIIMAPKKRLKAVQRALHDQLVKKLSVSEHAHGFVPNRCTRSGAMPHANKAVVVGLDLEDFFGSVTFPRVRGFLIAMGYSYPVATSLALLMTDAERQPVVVDGVTHHVPIGSRYCVQGAPTSPGITNAITHKLDRRLSGLAESKGFVYTRYADDLAFSGDDVEAVQALLRTAKTIIESEGFRLNKKKTRVMRRSTRQRITGVTVNDGVGLSRSERRKLRALIHQHGHAPERRAEIDGKIAYVQMLNYEQAQKLKALLPQ